MIKRFIGIISGYAVASVQSIVRLLAKMKRQYLGDSKDSFKWDYHDFLMEGLGYSQFKIAWMMTRDDNGPDGKTSPELFPAEPEVLAFCNRLRSCREPTLLTELPATTGAGYSVTFHEQDQHLEVENRNL